MKSIRRFFLLLAGGLVTGLGLLLMPLPGPGGLPVALAGLAILSSEFPWARRLLERLKDRLRMKEAPRYRRIGLVAGLLALWVAGGLVA